MALSTGETIENPRFEGLRLKLTSAQRAGKKKLARSIHAKIKNSRADFFHKVTTRIAKRFSHVVVGDVSSSDIIEKGHKGLRKGVYDAAWGTIRAHLGYKAKKLGGSFEIVSERYTTQDCSTCGARSGPKGVEGLSVREWICSACGAHHHLDVNAATNILRMGHHAPKKGVSSLSG